MLTVTLATREDRDSKRPLYGVPMFAKEVKNVEEIMEAVGEYIQTYSLTVETFVPAKVLFAESIRATADERQLVMQVFHDLSVQFSGRQRGSDMPNLRAGRNAWYMMDLRERMKTKYGIK